MPKTKSFCKTAKQAEAVELLGSDAMHILLFGGSRSGKTLILLYAMIVRAMSRKCRQLVLRLRFNHCKTSVWMDTLPKVLSMVCPDVPVNWNKSDFVLEFPNGSEVWIGGLDDKDRVEKILGHEYSTILFNESSQITYDAVQTALSRLAENAGLTNKAFYDCNPPSMKHWAHKLFVDKVNPEDGGPLMNADDYAAMLMNPTDNRENLPAGYIEKVLAGLTKRKRERFLLGLWGDDVEGALWQADWIKRCAALDMDRIVVAVDPAVTQTKNSDETGIIVAGKRGDKFYVLEDMSGHYSPDGWGRVVVDAYRRWTADRVIGEVNNGGDLVEANIRQQDRNCAFRAVRASKGKAVRAEPIAALYEQGRCFHVGEFPELEDQMTTWVPPEAGQRAEYSPDRMDALVWAATELMLGIHVPTDVEALSWG